MEGLPPFTAGAVGYCAYDIVRRLENIGEHATDDLRDRRRVVRRRDPEVQVRKAVQVDDVVVPDRPLAAAEQCLVGLDDPRVRLDLRRREALQHAADRWDAEYRRFQQYVEFTCA